MDELMRPMPLVLRAMWGIDENDYDSMSKALEDCEDILGYAASMRDRMVEAGNYLEHMGWLDEIIGVYQDARLWCLEALAQLDAKERIEEQREWVSTR